GRTHGCTDQPAGVKKVLANSEPSTHGTKRTFGDVSRLSAFGGKADVPRAFGARISEIRWPALLGAVLIRAIFPDCPQFSGDAKSVRLLDQATDIVTNDLTQDFIDHRDISLAPKVIPELCLDH